MSKTIGAILDASAAAAQKASASQKAALEADNQATEDKAAYDASQVDVAKALVKTGPITRPNGDGTYSTFESSTTAPGFRVELSKGPEILVEDDPDPNSPVDPEEQPPTS